jgi:hypothetical protein
MPNFQALSLGNSCLGLGESQWYRSRVSYPPVLKICKLKGAKTHQSLYDRLAIIDQQAEDHQRQLNKLLDLYLNGDFPKDMLQERKSRLEETIIKLESRAGQSIRPYQESDAIR